MGVDEALPDLGGEPRSLSLSRELADRVAAAQPHRDLRALRAERSAGRKHCRLPRDDRPQLHRPASTSSRICSSPAPARTRRPATIYVVAPDDRRSADLLLRSSVGQRLVGLGEDPTRYQGATRWFPQSTGAACVVFWLDVKASNEPQQTIPPAEPRSADASQTLDSYVSLRVNFSIPQRQLGTRAGGEGHAVRQARSSLRTAPSSQAPSA